MMTSSLVKPVTPSLPDVFTLHCLLVTYRFHQKFKSECDILYTSTIDKLLSSLRTIMYSSPFFPRRISPVTLVCLQISIIPGSILLVHRSVLYHIYDCSDSPLLLKVISQLRLLQRAEGGDETFDREKWTEQLTPFLTLWKKLNQVTRGMPICLYSVSVTSLYCSLLASGF